MVCVECERIEAVQHLDVAALIAEQLSLEPKIVPAEIQEKRQEICKTCPFVANHTCTKCGCFYQFRSALPQKACPAGFWGKYQEK